MMYPDSDNCNLIMSDKRVELGVLKNPVHFLALGFGAGCSPKMPGTVGSLVGVVLYVFLQHLDLLVYGIVTLLLFLAGIWLCGRTSRDLGVADHPAIVWDEIVGYLVTMLAAPPGWIWPVTGFFLFRVFDISKPWPVNWADKRVSGGLGIMLDDLLAGIYALLILQIIAGML